MNDCLGLLLKFPIPGQVKTRLALDIGDQAAAELYVACVSDELEAVSRSGMSATVFHAENAPLHRYQCWLGPDLLLLPQRGADLGERMLAAFTDLFAGGARCAMLLGGDIPELAPEDLPRAAAAARWSGLALAPAGDGGYSLIAARNDRLPPDIFSAMPWSTPQVLRLTLERIKAAGRIVEMLPQLPDLDTLDGLAAFWRRQHNNPRAPRHTMTWLRDRAAELGLK